MTSPSCALGCSHDSSFPFLCLVFLQLELERRSMWSEDLHAALVNSQAAAARSAAAAAEWERKVATPQV